MKKIFALVFLFLNINLFSQTIPKNLGFVSDYENLFTPEQNANLTKILSDYEKETTIEIVVLTVSDYESDIADFAQKTATEWKVGKKDLNNGLLIIISKTQRVLRSQTGYGLEGYLPDGWLKHAGDSIGIKYKDNYYEGTIEFLNQIKEKIGKEGYSEQVNQDLINKNKSDKSLISWLIDHWIIGAVVFGIWFIILFIDPSLAINILFLILTAGKGGSSGGGGKFGGGGSSSKW